MVLACQPSYSEIRTTRTARRFGPSLQREALARRELRHRAPRIGLYWCCASSWGREKARPSRVRYETQSDRDRHRQQPPMGSAETPATEEDRSRAGVADKDVRLHSRPIAFPVVSHTARQRAPRSGHPPVAKDHQFAYGTTGRVHQKQHRCGYIELSTDGVDPIGQPGESVNRSWPMLCRT